MRARVRQCHCHGLRSLWHRSGYLIPLALFTIIFARSSPATVRYVNVNNPTPAPPYTSWSTAATAIQDALTPAVAGDLILVADGVYQVGSQSNSGLNRVNVSKAVTVQSVNGPSATAIVGYQMPVVPNGVDSIRCAFLTDGATLSGFTLTGGATQNSDSGGGVKCQSTNAVVTNCIVTGNTSGAGGGGIFSGTVIGCTISANVTVVQGGGGVASSIVKNSILAANSARSTATGSGGGAYSGSLTNCLIYNNRCGTAGGASFSSTLVNCTVVNNISYASDGPVSGGAAKNCIVYYNFARTNVPAVGSAHFTNCCVFPPPAVGAGNITNPPVFANLAASDFHLNPASPCINAGNNSFVESATDIDGHPRVVNQLVDLGAYEFQSIIHFVRTNKHTPIFPYTSWSTSATNIQDAIDAALPGDFVVVSNGVYKSGGRALYGTATNRVVVNNGVRVQSVNGPATTTIVGFIPATKSIPSGIRCVYLSSNAVLTGFTLTNGCARTNGSLVTEQSGGGAWCEDRSACLSNCVITGNFAAQWGGGAFGGTLIGCLLTNNYAFSGGAAASNNLISCALIGNAATNGASSAGGGVFSSTLVNCTISANRAVGSSSTGGGACFSALTNCVVTTNAAAIGGGIAYGSALNSLISSNAATVSGGGAFSTVMNDCILRFNLAQNGGGARAGTLNNCTLVANTATVSGGGAFDVTLNNCIIQNNFSASTSNYSLGTLNYCCTTPLPSGSWNNISNNPAFVNLPGGDFHLQGNSPCINSGNNSSVITLTDFDGAPRVVGGTVDIGAYEWQFPSSVISYAYLQQYGLPTDGSVDFTDSDGDGMNNWMEWQAGTVPTNAASVLKIISINSTNPGVILSWRSVGNRPYFVQRALSVAPPVSFVTVKSSLIGLTNSTSWQDTNVLGAGPFFYRVGTP